MKFNIITANEIVDTGMVSFKFIFDSKSDYKNHDKVKLWGCIRKDDSNGVSVNVFESGKGLVFGWGHEKFDDEKWLAQLTEKSPAATLLMEKEHAKVLKNFCDKNQIEYAYHYFDGVLTSA